VDIVSLGSLPIGFLLVLLCVKMLATGITLGSGGSGGVFAPTLLIGAITGALISHINILLTNSSPETLSLLVVTGMATAFAAVAQAPLTAAFICFEIISGSASPALLFILILCCVVSAKAYKILFRSVSVYSIPLPVVEDDMREQKERGL
jgi:chloride channel protein, CIC family